MHAFHFISKGLWITSFIYLIVLSLKAMADSLNKGILLFLKAVDSQYTCACRDLALN